MAAKKQVYIEAELEWAEQKLQEWKDYVDANPLNELEAEIRWKETSKGGALPMVIASKEAQIKCIRDTMKEYLALLKVVGEMREVEAKKIEACGGKQIGGIMEDKLTDNE